MIIVLSNHLIICESETAITALRETCVTVTYTCTCITTYTTLLTRVLLFS